MSRRTRKSPDKYITEEATQAIDQARQIAAGLGDMYCEPMHFMLAVAIMASGNIEIREWLSEALIEVKDDNSTAEAHLKYLCDHWKLSRDEVADAYEDTYSPLSPCSVQMEQIVSTMANDVASVETIFVQCMLMSDLDPDSYTLPEPIAMDNPLVTEEGSNLSTVKYTTDLVQSAADGLLDPIIGREKVIKKIEGILKKRTKNNPVLIGDPGVGKTAIVEGIAQKIADGVASHELSNKRILMLDMAALMAGTTLRGMFEERLKDLVDSLDGEDAILFIDEAHMMMGAGTSGGDQGGMDMANMLKPALSRRKLQVIAATTREEYEKIVTDGALERRFEPVNVNEPTPPETLDIIMGVRDIYENYHSVAIPDDVCEEIVRLADAHIHDRKRPDKTIDLLDETCVAASLRLQLNETFEDLTDRVEELDKRFAEKIIKDGPASAAAVRKELDSILAKISKLRAKTREAPLASTTDVQDAIYQRLDSKFAMYDKSNKEVMKDVAAQISKSVVGQDEAIDALVEQLRTGYALAKAPVFCVILDGKSGSGKTEIAKKLGETCFENIVEINMADYKSDARAESLRGSPRGYVDSRRGGILTRPLRHQPNSLLILENIDNTNPNALDTISSMISKGYIDDGVGRTSYLKDAGIILTTGGGGFGTARIGFTKKESKDAVPSKGLPSEVLKGVKRVTLREITSEEAPEIAEEHLHRLSDRIGRGITYTKSVLTHICEDFDSKYGARSVVSAIQEKVEPVVADNPGSHAIHLTMDKKTLVCREGDKKHGKKSSKSKLGNKASQKAHSESA